MSFLSSPPTRAPYKKIFRDPEKLQEMLEMASRGIPMAAIARHFGVDHTTIMHRCKKHQADLVQMKGKNAILGIRLTPSVDHYKKTRLRKDIIELMKQGMLLEDIAEAYGLSVDAVVIYCKKVDIDYKKIYEEINLATEKGYLTEEGFPRWINDSVEGRVCRGRTPAGRAEELKEREKRERRQKRIDLLSY